MKEPYTEGVATHGDPESCVVIRKGVGEALTGARAGRAIEPRNQGDRGAQAVIHVEGNIGCGAMREPQSDPARSENLCMTEPPCARTGRSRPRPFG